MSHGPNPLKRAFLLQGFLRGILIVSTIAHMGGPDSASFEHWCFAPRGAFGSLLALHALHSHLCSQAGLALGLPDGRCCCMDGGAAGIDPRCNSFPGELDEASGLPHLQEVIPHNASVPRASDVFFACPRYGET